MRLLLNSFCTRILHRRLRHNVETLPDKFFVTTPIYYLNSVPHIGHFYTNLLADVVKRWYDMRGVPTHFSTGTDEHGLKVLTAAESRKQRVETYCDQLSAQFKSLFDAGAISYTSFVRTTDSQHITTVQHIWHELEQRGYIRRGSYEGWYSVSDEAYVSSDQAHQVEGDDGEMYMACMDSGNRLEWAAEENFVFPLSIFSHRLLSWLDSGVIHPPHHTELIRQWIRSGLPDLSLSRRTNKNPWGIPVPGNPDQNVYVWLDALVNYLTVSNYQIQSSSSSPSSSSPPSSPPPSSSSPPTNWWPPDYQVLGKDILKFHAVYWPCFLMALELPLPRRLLCHGHWMVEKMKMSKSRGNVVDPRDRLTRWSADALRYYLLKESSIHSDCDYSDHRAVECINSDLVNTLGNLLSRSSGKSLNPSQTFPPLHRPTYQRLCEGYKEGFDLLKDLYELAKSIDLHYRNFNNNKALEAVMARLHEANCFFQHCQPWKKSALEVDCILHVSLEVVRVCSLALLPVTPTLANKALDRLNTPLHQRSFKHMSQPVHLLRTKDYKLGVDTGVLLGRIKMDKEEVKMKKS